MTDSIALFRGKPLTECDTSELLEVIDHLTKSNSAANEFQIISLRSKVADLERENEKLWKCLGNRH